MRLLTRILHELYVIALLVSAVVLILAPFHLKATETLQVTQTLADGQLLLSQPLHAPPEPGRRVPYFRFPGASTHPVGMVRIVGPNPQGKGILAQAEPSSFRFPLGAQGTVLAQSNDKRLLWLNIGSGVGVAKGAKLQLFSDNQPIGLAEVLAVARDSSQARLLASGKDSLIGTRASLYTVPNTVTYCYSKTLFLVEKLAGAALLLLLVFRWAMPRAWQRFVAAFKTAVGTLARPRLVWAALLYPVMGYLVVRFLLRAWDAILVRIFGRVLPSIHRLAQADRYALYPALGIATLVFFYVLLRHRRSPWRLLRDKARYVPPDFGSPVVRKWAVWALQVVIVYAFANTLIGALRGNLEITTILAWPNVTPSYDTLPHALRSLGQLFTHAPTWSTASMMLQSVNLIVFSVTIIGSLVGYGYGVVSILWGKNCIRNVDFTLTGWLVNGVCYGALFGAPLWGFLPELVGTTPGIVDGPLHYAVLVMGLVLNLLYSFSIYNMWTRFGVMVDKGMVDNLMFAVVRHPSYTLEGVMFAMLGLHHTSQPIAFITLGVYSFLYWVRSERDEDFMTVSNPEYTPYKSRVPYKYLPGLV